MWKAFLQKSWLHATRLYDAFFALGEGLRSFRRVAREMAAFRPPGKPAKRESFRPSVEVLGELVMPTAVQFSASNYYVAENAGSVTITATLDASSSNTVTANYSTSNMSAVAGTDYTSTSGAISISAGSTSTTFTIPILNHPESMIVAFSVTLSNPTNAWLGSPSTSAVDINEPPTASDSSLSVVHGHTGSVPQSAMDPQGWTLTPSIVTNPSHGSVVYNSGTFSFDYTANNNYTGSDSFQWKVNDGTFDSNTATVSITVTDNAPTAVSDTYNALHGAPLVVSSFSGVLFNDTDMDGDTLTASLVSTNHGTVTLNSNGSFTYLVNSGYAGSSDSFVYVASDGVLTSSNTTVTINLLNTTASELNRSDDPRAVPLVPIGESSVDINLGVIRLAQPLDFDISPGTDVGRNPAFVYNGATVAVRPVFQANLDTSSLGSPPTMISLQLTWDGSTQSPVYFSPYGATSPLVMAVESSTAVAQTGRYDWRVDVTVTASGTNYTGSFTGRSSIVVQDSSVSGQKDPYGAGWGIAGGGRLVSVSDGIMYVYGTGESRFFANDGSGGYITPAGDFGTLVATTAGFTYTANGSIEEKFDANGMMVRAKGVDNSTTTYAYDSDKHLTQVITDDGGTASLAYSSGFLTSVTEPGSRTVGVAMTGGSVPDVTQITDAAGFTRSFSYDTTHRMAGDSWDPYTEAFHYDSAGMVNQLWLGSSYYIPPYSITVAEGRAINTITTTALATQTTIADPLTHTTTYDLDSFGRETAEVRPVGGGPSWGYANNNLVTTATDGDGYATSYGYDSSGQLPSVSTPDGGSTTYTRDGTFYDNITQTVQSPSVTTSAAFNDKGQMTASVGGDGYTMSYGWSGNRMSAQVDPDGNTTSFSPDAHQRISQVTDPNGNASTVSFDGSGNVSIAVDGGGNTIASTYDADNRLIAQTNPAGDSFSYTLSAAGFQTRSVVGGITTSQAFNGQGIATQSVDGDGYTTLYQLDHAGNATGVVDPGGFTTRESFDSDNRVTQTVDPAGTTFQVYEIGRAS